jgi:Tol biopolymer transport system component
MGWLGGLSPDGTQMLVYTGCSGNSCQLQVATLSSGNLTLLDSTVGSSWWAPDSHAVAYIEGGNQAGSLHVVSRDGSSNSVFMDGAELAGWTGPDKLLAIRKGVPAPYAFQNGLYLVTVR